MEREIVFRGKLLKTGKWVEGYYCSVSETTYAFAEDYVRHPVPKHHCIACDEMTDWGLPNRLRLYEVDPATIGQYAGFKDCNGRRIFEGDILQCNENPSELVKAAFGEFGVIEVETEERIDNVIGWHYEVIPTDALSKMEPFCLPMPLTEFYVNQCSMVVMGNIHDNPELLRES